MFLFLVTSVASFPVGFEFYHPDPLWKEWKKEDDLSEYFSGAGNAPSYTSSQFKYGIKEIAMKETNNGWTQEAYIKAYRFAAERHKGQLVPGTEWSYLAHLSMVSMEIMAALNHETGIDGNFAVQAAILHDTIEDTDTTYEELLSKFGQHVADGVLALSKDENVEKQDQMSDSLRRIKLQPKEIWMVKMADRITNLQPPPPYWTTEKKKKYLDQAKLILSELTFCSAFLSSRLNDKIKAYRTEVQIVCNHI